MLPTYPIEDFKGVISLSTNRFTTANFTQYENVYIPQYIYELLGVVAFNEISTSTKLKWTKLLDGGVYDKGYFAGFSEVLKYLLYFHIVRDDFSMSDVGAVQNNNENSTKVKHYGIAKDRYNKAVKYLMDVYKYIDDSVFEYTATTTDLGGGVYSVEIVTPTRTFLEDGELIELDEVFYPINNHVVGVGVETFEVAVDATLFKYTPYKDVVKNQIEVIVL
jgi:hypothetical protein